MVNNKPIYEIGTILVVTTHDGANKKPHFFKITKSLKSGNYHAVECPVSVITLDAFTTCEGYKKQILPDPEGKRNFLGTVNLKWYSKYEAFSFEPPVFLAYNEVYDPAKEYFAER